MQNISIIDCGNKYFGERPLKEKQQPHKFIYTGDISYALNVSFSLLLSNKKKELFNRVYLEKKHIPYRTEKVKAREP